jgi:hypothetical protein
MADRTGVMDVSHSGRYRRGAQLRGHESQLARARHTETEQAGRLVSFHATLARKVIGLVGLGGAVGLALLGARISRYRTRRESTA